MLFNGKEKYGSDIKLGEKYRDAQTGTEGVATAIHFYQYACERVTLEVVVRGKIEEYSFDAPRLETLTEPKERARAARTGGPGEGVRQASSRAGVPGR